MTVGRLSQGRSPAKWELRQAFPGPIPVGPQVQPGAHGFERHETGLEFGQQLGGVGGGHLVLDGNVRLQLLLVLRGELPGKIDL